mmetsp:Transcript_33478/g.39336  ORF Transcript_33478/g.39336 Transcript_33478/m.39336 type:complete len:1893 (-) Transcript_33478:4554-10232(-)
MQGSSPDQDDGDMAHGSRTPRTSRSTADNSPLERLSTRKSSTSSVNTVLPDRDTVASLLEVIGQSPEKEQFVRPPSFKEKQIIRTAANEAVKVYSQYYGRYRNTLGVLLTKRCEVAEIRILPAAVLVELAEQLQEQIVIVEMLRRAVSRLCDAGHACGATMHSILSSDHAFGSWLVDEVEQKRLSLRLNPMESMFHIVPLGQCAMTVVLRYFVSILSHNVESLYAVVDAFTVIGPSGQLDCVTHYNLYVGAVSKADAQRHEFDHDKVMRVLIGRLSEAASLIFRATCGDEEVDWTTFVLRWVKAMSRQQLTPFGRSDLNKLIRELGDLSRAQSEQQTLLAQVQKSVRPRVLQEAPSEVGRPADSASSLYRAGEAPQVDLERLSEYPADVLPRGFVFLTRYDKKDLVECSCGHHIPKFVAFCGNCGIINEPASWVCNRCNMLQSKHFKNGGTVKFCAYANRGCPGEFPGKGHGVFDADAKASALLALKHFKAFKESKKARPGKVKKAAVSPPSNPDSCSITLADGSGDKICETGTVNESREGTSITLLFSKLDTPSSSTPTSLEPWIVSSHHFEMAGIYTLRTNNRVVMIIAAKALVYELRMSNGLAFLDGYITRRGSFCVGAVPRGTQLRTLSVMVDSGATVNVCDKGWTDILDMGVGAGRAVAGVGGAVTMSAGWGTLSFMFPVNAGARWKASDLAAMFLSRVDADGPDLSIINFAAVAPEDSATPADVFHMISRHPTHPMLLPMVDSPHTTLPSPVVPVSRFVDKRKAGDNISPVADTDQVEIDESADTLAFEVEIEEDDEADDVEIEEDEADDVPALHEADVGQELSSPMDETPPAPLVILPSTLDGHVAPTGEGDHAPLLLEDDVAVKAPRGRMPSLTTAEQLHTRLNMINPDEMRTYSNLVLGVDDNLIDLGKRSFRDDHFHRAASKRSVTHKSRTEESLSQLSNLPVGAFVCVDLTPRMPESIDGMRYGLLCEEQRTGYGWAFFMKKSGTEAVLDALSQLYTFIQVHTTGCLKKVRIDMDATVSVAGRGDDFDTALVKAWKDKYGVSIERAPAGRQALNVVEGACAQLYYFMNVNMHRGHSSMKLWCDCLRGAIYQRNVRASPQSHFKMSKWMTRYEAFFGRKPDISKLVAAPGQGVFIHNNNPLKHKANMGKTKSVSGIFVCPAEGAGFVVRCLEGQRKLRVVYDISVIDSDAALPARLVQSDELYKIHPSLSPHTEAVRDSIRSLFAEDPNAPLSQSLVVFDPLTQLPVALVPAIDSNGDYVMVNAHNFIKRAVDLPIIEPESEDEHSHTVPPLSSTTTVAVVEPPATSPTPVVAPLPPTPTPVVAPSPTTTVPAVTSPTGDVGTTIINFKDIHHLRDDVQLTFRPLDSETQQTRANRFYNRARNSVKVLADLTELCSKNRTRALSYLKVWVRAGRVRVEGFEFDNVSLQNGVAYSFGIAKDLVDIMESGARNSHALRQRHETVLATHDGTLKHILGLEEMEDGPSGPALVGEDGAIDALIAECVGQRQEDLMAQYMTGTVATEKILLEELMYDTGRLYHCELNLGTDEAPNWCKLTKDPTLFKNLRAAIISAEWEGDDGWKVAALANIDQIMKHGAMEECDADAIEEAREKYGDAKVEVKNMVSVVKQKYDAQGRPTRKKVRFVVADKVSEAKLPDTFSPALSSTSRRIFSQLCIQLPGAVTDQNDIAAAYYYGTPIDPSLPGGRVLFCPIPDEFSELGYRVRDEHGRRRYFKIVGNMPGRQDAGSIWYRTHRDFLFDQGFKQSVVDRCIFYQHDAHGGILIVGVYVDDTWRISTSPTLYSALNKAWNERFELAPDVAATEGDFCGGHIRRVDDKTVVLTCDRMYDDLEVLLTDHPLKGMKADTPMLPKDPTACVCRFHRRIH